MSILSKVVEGLFCTLAIIVDAKLFNAQILGKDLREKQNRQSWKDTGVMTR